MGGGFHGKYDLAFYPRLFPRLFQELIVSCAVVAETEWLADNLAVLGDDDRLMVPLAMSIPNDEHGVVPAFLLMHRQFLMSL